MKQRKVFKDQGPKFNFLLEVFIRVFWLFGQAWNIKAIRDVIKASAY